MACHHQVRTRVNELEMAVLRGYRLPAGLPGLYESLAGNDKLGAFIERRLAAPLASISRHGQVRRRAWQRWQGPLVRQRRRWHREARWMMAAPTRDGALHIWANEDGESAAALLASLAEHGGSFEADTGSFPQILAQMMAARTVRRTWQTHPRLSILGPVEARMQSADRLILGGFNEGNWPPRPEIDPWMNAEMREAAGLQPHNWRTGLSAHDVWLAICAPVGIVTRAIRNEDAVTTPCRWLQRLRAVLAANPYSLLFPIVKDIDTMLLVGEVQRSKIDKALQHLPESDVKITFCVDLKNGTEYLVGVEDKHRLQLNGGVYVMANAAPFSVSKFTPLSKINMLWVY